MKHIFEYYSYKDYLESKIRSFEKDGRGVRQRMAKSAGCTASYLSQVMRGKPHLTLEQSEEINRYLGHTKTESQYFLLLVQFAKAGTQNLKAQLKEQIEAIRSERFNLKKRLQKSENIEKENQHIYYSSWIYAAIHVMLSIPQFNQPHLIAAHLNLPINMVANVIEFLREAGLIEKGSSGFKHSGKHWHLERQSPFIQRHHINWRSQALQSVEKNLIDDIHYSNVMAFAEKDAEKIKEILIAALAQIRDVIKDSPEEKAYVFSADFFAL